MVRRVWGNVGQVAGLLALFVALGGPAWAASAIDGAMIKASTVTGKQVKNSSLTGSDVKNATLTGADVKDGSLDGRDVKDGSIGGGDVTDASLEGKDVKDGSLGGADVADGSLDGADVGDGSLTGGDVKDGTIGAADLAPGTIPAAPTFSVADGSITSAKFADDATAPLARALPGLRTEPAASTPNVIGGADGNAVTAGAVGAAIGGGGAAGALAQTATDDFATVAGGRENRAGNGGGSTSDAIGATVGGGEGNLASGQYATIPGGIDNTASGAFSSAFGRRAKAVNQGSFVFADSTNADYTSTADNQASFRVANGVHIANDAGNAKAVPVGTRYRDNSTVAWGRVTATGTLDSNFNVASVTHGGTGVYTITLNTSLLSGFTLIPAVTPEIDGAGAPLTPPVGAANVRIVATDQFAAGSTFNVYVYNGSYALVDNDFSFQVTGR